MLPEDENTPEKRANKLWAYFNKKDNGERGHMHSDDQSESTPHVSMLYYLSFQRFCSAFGHICYLKIRVILF